MSITVPEGLSDLLQDFAIVVLREKPKDLVEFAANYFTELHERSKSGKMESPREDADKQKSPDKDINVVITEETVEMQDEGTIATHTKSSFRNNSKYLITIQLHMQFQSLITKHVSMSHNSECAGVNPVKLT